VSYPSVGPQICSLSKFTAQAPVGCIFNYRSKRLIGSGLRALIHALRTPPPYPVRTSVPTVCSPLSGCLTACFSVHHQCAPIYIHIGLNTRTNTCTRRAVTNTPKLAKHHHIARVLKKTQGLYKRIITIQYNTVCVCMYVFL